MGYLQHLKSSLRLAHLGAVRVRLRVRARVRVSVSVRVRVRARVRVSLRLLHLGAVCQLAELVGVQQQRQLAEARLDLAAK